MRVPELGMDRSRCGADVGVLGHLHPSAQILVSNTILYYKDWDSLGKKADTGEPGVS